MGFHNHGFAVLPVKIAAKQGLSFRVLHGNGAATEDSSQQVSQIQIGEKIICKILHNLSVGRSAAPGEEFVKSVISVIPDGGKAILQFHNLRSGRDQIDVFCFR